MSNLGRPHPHHKSDYNKLIRFVNAAMKDHSPRSLSFLSIQAGIDLRK